MRQERRHCPENSKTQHTTDSWDFSLTTMSSRAPSLTGNSPRVIHKPKTLSFASESNHEDEPEIQDRLSNDNGAKLPGETTMTASATTSSLKSDAPPPRPHPTAPIPMPHRDTGSVHERSLLSLYSPAVTPPTSTSPSTSPSLWHKLTRKSSRNVLVDEESPKGNSISRFLSKSGSFSWAQHPNILPA